jgi:hypothetical protein
MRRKASSSRSSSSSSSKTKRRRGGLEATMMHKMDEAAKYEKSSKLLTETHGSLDSGVADARRRYDRVLESCKQQAETLHIDVRHAAVSRTRNLNKQVFFLETTKDNLRRHHSALESDASEMKHEIDELRLTSGRLDKIFDVIKAEMEQAQAETSAVYDAANGVQSEHNKVVRQIERIKRDDELRAFEHEKSLQICYEIVAEEKRNAEEAQRRTHLAILAERQAHRRGKDKQPTTMERKATLGKLSDDEEAKMRERMRKLENEMQKLRPDSPTREAPSNPAKLVGRPQADIQRFQERLTRLHILAKIRHEQPGLEHTQQLNAAKRSHFEDIDPGALDIETIVKVWKKNEKECFDLVKSVQEINTEIRESEAETKLIKARLRTMEKTASSTSENTAMQKIQRKKDELEAVKMTQLHAQKAVNALKDENGHICKAVDNALTSTSTRGGDTSVDVVRSFNLGQFMGVLEARALDIIGAYMIYKSMYEDEDYQSHIQKQLLQGSPILPLQRHRRYRIPTGPAVQSRRRAVGLLSSSGSSSAIDSAPLSLLLRSSPLKKYGGDLSAGISEAIAHAHVAQDRPLSVAETRRLFRAAPEPPSPVL